MISLKIAAIFAASVLLTSTVMWLPKINTINKSNEHQKDICTDLIDSLNEIIIDQKEQILLLKNEIQFKESEVIYWSYRYDSIKQKNK